MPVIDMIMDAEDFEHEEIDDYNKEEERWTKEGAWEDLPPCPPDIWELVCSCGWDIYPPCAECDGTGAVELWGHSTSSRATYLAECHAAVRHLSISRPNSFDYLTVMEANYRGALAEFVAEFLSP